MASIYFADDFTSQISQIIPPSSKGSGGLYLGNFQATKNTQLLKKYRISAVISILSEKQVKFSSNGISHLLIKIQDSPFQNIGEHFLSCNQFITKNLKIGNVFVHCMAGISRSASIVLAYLMKTKKYSLKYALNKVKRRRNVVNPNKGFLFQLQQYEKKLQSQLGLKLK